MSQALTKAFYGILVTLPADTNPHNLLELAIAIEPELAELRQNCRWLSLQPGLDNTDKVFIGDDQVASDRYAITLLVGDNWGIPSSVMVDVPLGALWAAGEGGGEKIALGIML